MMVFNITSVPQKSIPSKVVYYYVLHLVYFFAEQTLILELATTYKENLGAYCPFIYIVHSLLSALSHSILPLFQNSIWL